LAGFDAASVVEPLDYTLRPHVDKAGTIREPNDRQIADYLAGYQQMVKDYRDKLPDELVAGIGNPDVGAILDATAELDTELVIKLNTEVAGLVAALCSGDPSKDEILGLPPRIRAMFCAWVQKEVMSPEAAPGGGRSQVKTLRSVAAG
jgi:hypothetical protein